MRSENTYKTDFFQKQLAVERKHFWFKTRNQVILNELRKIANKDDKILEIGCGTGNVLVFLEENGFKVEGADLFEEAIEICRKRTESKLYQFDVRNIPFDNMWDIIGCFDVIEHLEEDALALENIKKALKPGGRLILTVPAVKILYSKHEGTHKRRYSKRELIKKLKMAGFKIRRITHFFLLLLPFIFPLRLWRKITNKNYVKNCDLEINPLINGLLYKICLMEIGILKRINLPLGTSLLVVAEKD